jgi:hypothetical protein
MRTRFLLALGVLIAVAGCGAQEQPSVGAGRPYPSNSLSVSPTSPAPSPTPSTPLPLSERPSPPARSPLPTLTRNSSPPDNPTDQIKKTTLVVGLVTHGGTGPCFGVQTDDGTEYALYSALELTLKRGQHVQLWTRPSSLRIDCGSGQFREITGVKATR